MNNTLPMAIQKLEQEMNEKGLKPKEPINFDGKSHEYKVHKDGKFKAARYTAFCNPLEDHPNYPNVPLILCFYGFINEKNHTFSSTS